MATKEDIESDLALEIEGEQVSSKAFITAVDSFFKIIAELAKDITQENPPIWNLRVKSGSNLVFAIPPLGAEKYTNEIVYNMKEFLSHIESGNMSSLDFSEKAINEAKKMTKILRENACSIKLWLKKIPLHLTEKSYENINEFFKKSYTDYGSLSGYLKVLSGRGKIHATLYEDLHDKAVRCDINGDSLIDDLTKNFTKRVEVYGDIRFTQSGQPQSIDVKEIIPFPEKIDLPTKEEIKGILKGY